MAATLPTSRSLAVARMCPVFLHRTFEVASKRYGQDLEFDLSRQPASSALAAVLLAAELAQQLMKCDDGFKEI